MGAPGVVFGEGAARVGLAVTAHLLKGHMLTELDLRQWLEALEALVGFRPQVVRLSRASFQRLLLMLPRGSERLVRFEMGDDVGVTLEP